MPGIRHTGVRKRIVKHVDSSEGTQKKSSLNLRKRRVNGIANFALLRYKRGQFSAVDVQELHDANQENPFAHLLEDDPIDPRESKNASRDTMRNMARSSTLPLPYYADIVSWDATNSCQCAEQVAFLLPHELAEALIGPEGPQQYTTIKLEDPLFAARTAWGQRVNPTVPNPEEFAPIGIWGDAAPLNKRNKSLYLLQWNFLQEQARYWICAFASDLLCKCGCKGKCTFDSIMDVIVWSFRCMYFGCNPMSRHDGAAFSASRRVGDSNRAQRIHTPLTLKACVLHKRADWAWLKQLLELNCWSSSGNICWMCNCTRDQMTDATMQAPWRNTILSHAQFVKERFQNRKYNSSLWNLPGFDLSCIKPDLLHVGDLGITQAIVGNIMFELFQLMGGKVTKPHAALGELLNLITLASRHIPDLKCRPINALTLPMIKATGCTPRFKAKGAESRRMVHVLVWLLQNIFPPRDEFETLRLNALLHLHWFYEECKRWVPNVSGRHAARHARRHVILYIKLARVAEARRPRGQLQG
jgi:hypothetical protein